MHRSILRLQFIAIVYCYADTKCNLIKKNFETSGRLIYIAVYNSDKKFWPDIIDRNIAPDYSGIRTKTEDNDFMIQDYTNHKVPGLVNLFGIDSPGLTSSIPIGEYVSSKCLSYLR